MKSIIIASNHSGGGKTTFTLGIMNLLKKRGFEVQGYKVGPDYIDTAFHKEVTGKGSRNLDIHLMGEKGVRYNYSKGTGNIGIIEGVMGLYDGIGKTWKTSTYNVSHVLDDMPIILVLSPKGVSLTLCAEINGLIAFKNANIKGIVLNNVSEKYYKLLKCMIEENCNVKVIGFIPKDEKITLKSRHLGLIQSSEVDNLHEKIDIVSHVIEENIDVDYILNTMKEFNYTHNETEEKINTFIHEVKKHKPNMRIGIACDKSLCFYYENNIELLKDIGEVIFFSPLSDEKIPENLDFLYIGGGYPEVFREKLESNISMRKSIKNALDNGLKCYAECGGLMYLTKSIDGSQMVGFFDGESFMTKGLKNFGYCNVKIDDGKSKDILINAHEFHKSYVELNEKTVYEVTKNVYDGSSTTWKCGYTKNNTLGGYAHINFLGNVEFLKTMLLK